MAVSQNGEAYRSAVKRIGWAENQFIFRSPNFEIALSRIDLVKVVHTADKFFSDTYTVSGFPFKKTLKPLPTVIKWIVGKLRSFLERIEQQLWVVKLHVFPLQDMDVSKNRGTPKMDGL